MGTGRKTDRDDDLQREIRQHLELDAEEREAEGMAPTEARRAAAVAFGNVSAVREDARSVWWPLWLQHAGQDLRYAARVARRTPAFTCGAVLIFALGISTSTTVFSVLNAVVLAPLPFKQPDQLVRIVQANPARGVDAFSVSLPLLRDWQTRSRSFNGIAAERGGTVTVLGIGEPLQMDAKWISPNMFSMLGLAPVVGRTFRESDDLPQSSPVVMVSHSFWRRAFGMDSLIVGRTLTVDGRAHEIIGVAPPDALSTADHVLLPVGSSTEDRRGLSILDVYARLRPDVTITQAGTEMVAIAEQLGRDHPDDHAGWSARLIPLAESVVGPRTSQVLFLVLASVGVLLVVACANLSGLLLVRASTRTREMAIRAAVGGGRGRIVRQLLAESLLLAALGGTVGILIAISATRLLRTAMADQLPRALEIGVDGWVLLLACAMSVVTGVLAGLAPARQMSRLEVTEGLRAGSRSVTSGPAWSRNLMVVGQLALSVVLLTVAGLTVRTLTDLYAVDLGFTPARIVTVQVAPRERPEAFFAQLLERVRALSGVTTAGAASSAPMTAGNISLNVFPVGPARIAATDSIQADWRIVTDGYFGAMETPLLAGRDFTSRDDDNGPKVIIVNQTLARMVWGEDGAVGRQLDLGGGGGDPATVVGLVRDMRHRDPAVPPSPTYYVPAARGVWGSMTLAVRTNADALSLVPQIKTAVASMDPTLPVYGVHTMDALVRKRLAPQRMVAVVLSTFGALGLLLAVIGIYGVMSFVTRQRGREAAIRLALGATRRRVIGPLVREGALLVAAGALIGVAAAVPVITLMRTVIADIPSADPMMMAVSVLLLAAAAMLACYLPARRVSRVDPVTALRGD